MCFVLLLPEAISCPLPYLEKVKFSLDIGLLKFGPTCTGKFVNTTQLLTCLNSEHVLDLLQTLLMGLSSAGDSCSSSCFLPLVSAWTVGRCFCDGLLGWCQGCCGSLGAQIPSPSGDREGRGVPWRKANCHWSHQAGSYFGAESFTYLSLLLAWPFQWHGGWCGQLREPFLETWVAPLRWASWVNPQVSVKYSVLI